MSFFQNLLKQLNTTNIALTSKVTASKSASQYRPTAYNNVLYKCITKMICQRLKRAIDYLIANNQLAFVQGRSMIYNILICHDLLMHYNKKTTPKCLMKIYVRKTYDMVGWGFIIETLTRYGFSKRFFELVMTCFSTLIFTIKISGKGPRFFAGRKGLRHKNPCPLSYLCWLWSTSLGL